MAVHITPLMLHVRIYPDAVDVNKPMRQMTGGYYCHLVILINDLGIARVEGLDQKIRVRDCRALADKLREYGVIRMEWRHKHNEHFYDLN